jgi:hypothetical protein
MSPKVKVRDFRDHLWSTELTDELTDEQREEVEEKRSYGKFAEESESLNRKDDSVDEEMCEYD